MQEINLEHLQEDEVQLILKVLERDAKIQKREDARRRRLQSSIKGERIPEKRLSIHIRTGDWMSDMTAATRSLKKRGTDLVRASIRRKDTTKSNDTDGEKLESKSTQEFEHIAENDHEGQKFGTKPTAIVTPTNKSPVRRTSIRKKKTSSKQEKQIKEVKFDTDKTEKYIYEQANLETGSQESLLIDTDVKKVPTIVIDDSDVALELDDKIKNSDDSAELDKTTDEPVSYDDKIYSSSATFESFHNSIGKDMHKPDEKNEENIISADTQGSPKSEKPVSDEPLTGKKKIRVVKRKGSSRRKPSPKITDDSSRNTLFSMPDEEKPDHDKSDLNKETETLQDQVEENTHGETDTPIAELSSKPDVVDMAPIAKEIHENVQTSYLADQDPVQDHNVKEIVEETVKPLLNYVDEIEVPKEENDKEESVSEIVLDQIKDVPIAVDVFKTDTSYVAEEKIDEQIAKISKVENVALFDEKENKQQVEEPNVATEDKGSVNQDLTVTVFETVKPVGAIAFDTYAIAEQVDKNKDNEDTNKMNTDLEHLSVDENKENRDKKETKTDLETQMGDLLSSMSATYDSMMPSIDKKDLDEVVAPPEKHESQTESIATKDFASLENIEQYSPQQENFKLSQDTNGQDISGETIVGNLVEEVLNTTEPIAAEIEETSEEKPTHDKPKKKVVKKIVKKKKATDEEQGSPKSDGATGKENDENSPKNLSKLSRTRTVRKKVVRKPPPPQT
uniref:uncharacterized protein LOC120328371 n=1 Tax=Styela clava TaxID=7725 RepID=UPI0019398ED8|nr:uncharacterized protein LOC120328371 [Styela clava]